MAKWFPHSKGGEFRRWFGNSELIVNWANDGEEIRSHPSSALRNPDKMFSEGVTWSHTTSGSFGARLSPTGTTFNVEGPTLFHNNPHFFLGLLCSNAALNLIQTMSQTLHFLVGTVSRVPTPEVSKFSASVTPAVKRLVDISKYDWDAYETSWDFTTLQLLSPDQRAETYARLRAHWQGMTDEMQRLEEENNRIFIDAYGLTDELTPEVPIEEITLNCNPAYRYGIKGMTEEREARLPVAASVACWRRRPPRRAGACSGFSPSPRLRRGQAGSDRPYGCIAARPRRTVPRLPATAPAGHAVRAARRGWCRACRSPTRT